VAVHLDGDFSNSEAHIHYNGTMDIEIASLWQGAALHPHSMRNWQEYPSTGGAGGVESPS
jgi:hypothetical protein